MKMELLNWNIGCGQIGKERDTASFSEIYIFPNEIKVLENTRTLMGSKISADKDFFIETRKIMMGMIPCLRDSKTRGHRAFWRRTS
jgi:hypothetical protein